MSSTISLQVGCQTTYNIWKEGREINDVPTFPEPYFSFDAKNGDMITFPMQKAHLVTVQEGG